MAETQLFVDRIEENWAVLITDAKDPEEEPLPLSVLPADVKAGDWLRMDIPNDHTTHSFFELIRNGEELIPECVRDEATGEAVKRQVQDLMNELSS